MENSLGGASRFLRGDDMISKQDLRRSFRARLETAVSEEAAAQARDALNERLVKFLSQRSGDAPEIWGAFQPHGFEPDILPALAQTAKQTSIQWAFPRIEGDDIVFYLPMDVQSPASASASVFASNKWGIREPDPACARRVEKSELAGLLVPGLAFDRSCNRMGRGRGYYDRFLAQAGGGRATSSQVKTPGARSGQEPMQLKIGIAHDRQISLEPLPVEPFDVTMDHVLTETACFSREASGTPPDFSSERKSS